MNYNDDNNKLTSEETVHDENVVDNKLKTKQYCSDKKYNVLTAIVYPLICVIIFTLVFFSMYDSENTTFIIRYFIGLVLYALGVFTILQTDAYLLVVPLPIITFYKVGSCETTKPLWVRMICGIISFILMFAPFIILLTALD